MKSTFAREGSKNALLPSLSNRDAQDNNEQLPLLGQVAAMGGGATGNSMISSSKMSAQPVSEGVTFSSSPSFFAEASLLRYLFMRSIVGHKTRARVCIGWGLFSLSLAFAVLKIYYQNTSARAFFIATTTLTTIGYAMSDKDGQTTDYPFLSVYFLFFVLPFSFMQSLVFIDATYSSSVQLNTRIAARCRRGVNAAQAFVAEFWSTMAVTAILLSFLIFLGMVCYSYFGKSTSWKKGIFYAITSTTTIGYGSFEVENDYGYYAVGVYAISCNYVVSIIFPSIASYFIVASENIEKVNRIRKEETILNQQILFRIDQQGAII